VRATENLYIKAMISFDPKSVKHQEISREYDAFQEKVKLIYQTFKRIENKEN